MKKSRVKKFHNLHEELAASSESGVENSNLSEFANRLHDIDDQFERINESKEEKVFPSRARNHDNHHANFDNSQSDEVEGRYQSDHLKNFLEEVKEYNVKKGYYEDSKPSDFDGTEEDEQQDPSVNVESLDDLDKDLKDIVQELEAVEQKQEQIIEETKIMDDYPLFGEPIVDTEELDIGLAVKELASDGNLESYEPNQSNLLDQDLSHELLEQTQTLQYKILDQEKDIDEMNHRMVRTNRLLNIVLSLLLFAIIVVVLLIIAQFI